MKRRLFNVATAVSLTLAITISVMWVRSYSATERFAHAGVHHATLHKNSRS